MQHALVEIPSTEETDDSNAIKYAIENYNYEEAARIVQSTQSIHFENLDEDIEILLKHRENELNTADSEDELGIIYIQRKAYQKMSDIVMKYQKDFELLINKQKMSMKKLKEQWIEDHLRAEELAKRKIGDLYHTSKVLANCGCFDKAAGLRDKVNEAKDKMIYSECKHLDGQFKQQFLALNKRHVAEMESLYHKMNCEIQLIKSTAEMAELDVRAKRRIRESMSPIKSINEINNNTDFTLDEKKDLINRISPRPYEGSDCK